MFMNALHIPILIKPYGPLCPEGADVMLELARDLGQRLVVDMAYDLLTRFNDQPLVGYALLLAAARHQGQTYEQPYGSMPYLYHLLDVGWCLAYSLEINDGLTVACGLWHDLLEDQKATPLEVRDFLSSLPGADPEQTEKIIQIIQTLARPAEPAGAKFYYEHLSQAPSEARLVKAADLICNTASLKAHARNWFGTPIVGTPQPHLIAKYIIESDQYLFNQPAFCSLERYPLIHNTLLGILQDLLTYLEKETPAQIGLLDQLALKRYRTGFRSPAFHIKRLKPI